MRVVAGNAAAFDGRLADAILEAERVALVRQRVDVLSPDRHDAGEIAQAVAGALKDRLEAAAASGASATSATWTSGEPSGASQCSGAFSPISPSSAARAAMPCWNSGGKLASESCGTPSALRPWKLSATVSEACLAGSAGPAAEVEHRDQPPQQLAAGVPVVDAQQEIGAGVGRGPGMQGPGLDVVQLERDARISGDALRNGLGGHSGHRSVHLSSSVPAIDWAASPLSAGWAAPDRGRPARPVGSPGRRRRGCAGRCRR